MNIFLLIIISNLLVSLISLIGILFFFLKKELLNKIIFSLISLSAGTLTGGAFIHLLPEAINKIKHVDLACFFTLTGFILFFLIEKFLHWHHCHDHCHESSHNYSIAYLNLIGDAVHNFTDGIIIAASYSISIKFGIATCIAIAVHEIPQEIGDFGILIYAGMKKSQALWLNFITACSAIIGGIIGYYLSKYMNFFVPFLLAFAAGAFIYIASSDIIPELKKFSKTKESILASLLFIFGIFIMWITKNFFDI